MVCLLHARSLICGLLYIVPSTFSISSYNHKLINTNLKILSLYPQTLIIQSSRFFNPSKTQIKSSKMSSNPSSSSTSGCSGGGGGGGSSSGGGGAGGGPCGACKFLRRKCVAGCVFAPFFDSDQGAAHFAAVHKVFGASNVSKLLLHLPVQRRQEAVVTICYEAQARLRDPIYGCVSHIFALQQQVMNLQAELAYIHAHLATLVPPLPPPPPPPQQTTVPPPGLTINDLTTASSPFLSCYDLSSLLEPMVPPSWTMQSPRRQTDPRQFIGFGEAPNAPTDLPPAQGGGSTSGEFQELARELLQRSDCESSRKNEGPSLPP